MRFDDQEGVTLIGLVMSIGLFAALMAPLVAVLGTGRDSFERGACLARLQDHGRWILEKMERDFRECRIDPDFEDDAGFAVGARSPSLSVDPRRPDDFDWDEGRISWETNEIVTYALALDAGEDENGLDDDGDGLVDEQRLTRTVDDRAGGVVEFELARNLPRESLSFERLDPRKIRVSILVTGRAERDELITASMSMDVFLRN